ncbi:MAG: PIN domain nuclease [Euryarchaeota archaeon CG_4_9_14_3_um_filter_38_12]|nr:MAG: PIN domain nuclease [Euryarchaeota archaeon CG_4_9_14_3_um_filter_38_12]
MEGKTLVLDASVIVKWYSEEGDTEKALQIRDLFLKNKFNIMVPDLMFYEVANVVRYARGIVDKEKEAILNNIVLLNLDVVSVSRHNLIKSLSLALKYDITVYDAVYLVIASQKKAVYVTADEKLKKKVALKNVMLLSEWKT